MTTSAPQSKSTSPRYEWTFGTHRLTAAELAAWTAAHAHEFYERAGRFSVREDDGYTGRGGEESVYREDAFSTAADHYGVPYDVFYNAWLSQTPINRAQLNHG